jgi:hypothetical protein
LCDGHSSIRHPFGWVGTFQKPVAVATGRHLSALYTGGFTHSARDWHGLPGFSLPRSRLSCRHTPVILGWSTNECLRAFVLSGANRMGLLVESPPDLPSNCSSLRDLDCTHSNYETRKSPVSVFIVTTSPNWDWVICAPAAFLGCGSRFSGSLSGIEP